jgi:hypothetical protein
MPNLREQRERVWRALQVAGEMLPGRLKHWLDTARPPWFVVARLLPQSDGRQPIALTSKDGAMLFDASECAQLDDVDLCTVVGHEIQHSLAFLRGQTKQARDEKLLDKIGDKQEALAVHRKALALRRELAEAEGADVAARPARHARPPTRGAVARPGPAQPSMGLRAVHGVAPVFVPAVVGV